MVWGLASCSREKSSLERLRTRLPCLSRTVARRLTAATFTVMGDCWLGSGRAARSRARRVAGSFRTLGVDAFREWLDANVYSRVGREKFPRTRERRINAENAEFAEKSRASGAERAPSQQGWAWPPEGGRYILVCYGA